MSSNMVGQGLATLGICALIGFVVWQTGNGYFLWALLALLIVWNG